ncbi:unnamed protein product [Paramecium pentaurelia]|uniref:Uncharacterized protein n=1 Tax=Paramecium pentaurelia TaxID=43138 RepID=A0A8S1WSI7_9CILI|nr:unnamed protein product [Paramecium pentaurelia]
MIKEEFHLCNEIKTPNCGLILRPFLLKFFKQTLQLSISNNKFLQFGQIIKVVI